MFAQASVTAKRDWISMIEVTIRDGRATRNRDLDTAEGGPILATIQRDEPLDVSDTINLADGTPVVVIGVSDNIRPGQSWNQTAFVGEVPGRQRPININLGACPEWTLQTAGPTETKFIRCVSAAEAEQINTAISFCRAHGTTPTYRLLNASYATWSQAFTSVANADRGRLHPQVTEALMGAFVGWLLVWRLVLDQADHDVSSQFGRESEQRTQFNAARSTAYDSSRGYRVIEALRNLVTHRGMPSLRLSRSHQLDAKTGQVTRTITYRFPASDLLASPKCPATIKKEFAPNPAEELDLPAIIDDAMAAMARVLIKLIELYVPELKLHIRALRPIFDEAADLPLLLRAKPPGASTPAGGLDIEMTPLHDLQHLVRNFPMAE
jgi:hypothetical protein